MLSQSIWEGVWERSRLDFTSWLQNQPLPSLNKFIKMNFSIQTSTKKAKYLTALPLPVPLCKALCTLSHCSPQIQPFQQREMH